ncbi:Response regulator of citrate/malate metabolism [Microbacterium azadirachtae]|uniref:Transcriptional regulatory protein n=1 Tax=Microbacterium azadirachtae TaxID=582680 RepID=A0A1I6IXM1_9MICO|nr:response regulator [Microbacterium azadirachtae]SFR71504.1 Response regulator of citrate/malate metabolism [Microbacterium azadirachtae]
MADSTVLVVDDDFRVASVHVGFVEAVTGFRVVGQAGSAAEALRQARELHPDLVLMDVYLPDGDGLDVVRQLLADPDPSTGSGTGPAVIVISAANDLATVRRAVQLGALHYLVKPFGFAELAERLTAFRQAQERIAALGDAATQDDVNRLFDLLRPAPASVPDEGRRLAPTLQAVLDAVIARRTDASAQEIATDIGISRTTAQRALTQLEQSGLVRLELRYGSTGRPEHRYAARRR